MIDYNKYKQKRLSLGDGVEIVLFEVLGHSGEHNKEDHNRNVYRFDSLGNIVWQIAYHEELDGYDPFIAVECDSEKRLIGWAWSGWRFEISLEDGNLRRLNWTK